MKEALKKKLMRQQEIVDTARNQKRDLTAEEEKEFSDLQKDVDDLKVKIAEAGGSGEHEPNALPAGGKERTAKEEKDRMKSIRGLCRTFGMDEKQEEEYIDGDMTIDGVREAVLNYLKEHNGPIGTRGTGDISVQKSAEDKFIAAAADSLVLRGGINIEKPEDGARNMMGMTLRDLAIEAVGNDIPEIRRKSAGEVFDVLMQRQYYNPTSAFPAILDQAINKAYIEGHKSVNVTFDQFTKKGTLRNFLPNDNNYLSGPAGEFLLVGESGELKHDVFEDKKRPQRKLDTYGRQFTLTRQAFINDDIDLVTKLPSKYAKAARKTINKQVYQILMNNPAIYDGTSLFSSIHKNLLVAGTGVTQTAMQKMIMALNTQLDEFGEAIIINPAHIIVPSGYAFDMYTLFFSPTINTSGNTQATNPLYKYRENIQVVEDPTVNVLAGGFGNVMPWFLVGNKDDTDFIQIDYLDGKEIPTIRRMETPGTLGFVWDIYLDWGITVMDYRGCIKNPGIAVANPLA